MAQTKGGIDALLGRGSDLISRLSPTKSRVAANAIDVTTDTFGRQADGQPRPAQCTRVGFDPGTGPCASLYNCESFSQGSNPCATVFVAAPSCVI